MNSVSTVFQLDAVEPQEPVEVIRGEWHARDGSIPGSELELAARVLLPELGVAARAGGGASSRSLTVRAWTHPGRRGPFRRGRSRGAVDEAQRARAFRFQ